MARLATVSIVFGVIVLAGSLTASAAQAPQGQGGGAPPPPLQDLQVFPKHTPRAQVITAMQAFSAALGVTCNHCHVCNGPGDPMNDFVGDTKPTRNMVRAMMRMVQDMNSGAWSREQGGGSGRPCHVRDVPSRRDNAKCGCGHARCTTAAPWRGPGGAAPGGAPPAGRGN